jgi:hypothetical protein
VGTRFETNMSEGSLFQRMSQVKPRKNNKGDYLNLSKQKEYINDSTNMFRRMVEFEDKEKKYTLDKLLR